MHHASRTLFFVGAASLSVFLSACHHRSDDLESDSRDLGQYSAIDLRGAAELKISVGQPESLKVVGSDYALKGLRTEVRNNTLYIQAKKSGWAWFGDRDELSLTITMPQLTVLKSSGAGEIQINGLNGGNQDVRVSGAHNLVATGQIDNLTIEMDGAGNIDYGKVNTASATVTVNGAGHVLVNPSQTLVATVNGVGAIQYESNPQKVESTLHGIGTIGRK